MLSERHFNRETEERPILIEEVNVTEQYILARDQFNTPIRLSLHFVDPIVTIPKTGEQWTAVRKGSDWFLGRNGSLDNGVEGLAPGDKKIEAQGRLHLAAVSIQFNGLTVMSGTGTPAGIVAAPVGSLYLRKDGAANTTFYIKESGTGTAGWVAK